MLENTNLNISDLPKISQKAAEDYSKNIESLTKFVDDELSNNDDINELIGNNSLDIMFENHRSHAQFMNNVFRLSDYKFLTRTILWVYKTYSQRGFSFDYFVIELKSWMKAVEEYLKPKNASLINEIYSFMLESHQTFIELSKKVKETKINIPDEYKQAYESFLKGLLDGNHKVCLKIVQKEVDSENDVREFFENILKPAMYEIGVKWEKGEISVADEHLTSSIASRVLSSLYSKFATWETSRGKATITAVANEFHEIGSRIIADSLELDEWEVDHLGVDTPISDLIDFLLNEKPFLVGLSVAIPFNLQNAVKTINKIKSHPELKDIKILIGGKVFNDNPGLWQKTGADAFAKNSDQAIKIAQKWWQKREE